MEWICGFLLGIAVGMLLILVLACVIAGKDGKEKDVKK